MIKEILLGLGIIGLVLFVCIILFIPFIYTSIAINCWDNTHTTNYSSTTRTWSNETNYFGLISDNNTYFKNVRAVYI